MGAQNMCWTFIIHYRPQVSVAKGMNGQGAQVLSQKYNIVGMVLFCLRHVRLEGDHTELQLGVFNKMHQRLGTTFYLNNLNTNSIHFIAGIADINHFGMQFDFVSG